jgi:aminomethyltransferase
VIDDLIVYYQGEQWWRLVVNAGTRDKDLAWMRRCASEWQTELLIIERTDLAILAVQGPQARSHVASLLEAEDREPALSLGAYEARECGLWFVARTGYTGEDGFEVMLPAEEAPSVWRALNAAGVASCGLGARDTLRLEAGMNLYGNDMDEQHHPLESNLAWTVAFEPTQRDFVGRTALERLRSAGVPRKLVGLLLEDRGVLRAHQRVIVAGEGEGEGEITSGSFSPTLERSIAFARVPRTVTDVVQVDIRGKWLPARVVKLPFVRHGRVLINL